MEGETLEVQEVQISPEVEQEALRTGWLPKEQFKGDVSKWKPADKWVERGKEFIPFIKAEKRQLEDKVSILENEIKQQKEMVSKIVNINNKYTEDFYDSKKNEIKIKKREAAEAQDWEAYQRYEDQESKFNKPEPIKIETKTETGIHPEIKSWMDRNAWFNVDREMTDYAMFIGEQLKNANDPSAIPGNEKAFIEKVDQKLKATFPQKFTNLNRTTQMVDDTNSRGVEANTGTKGKTWNDLPADAQAHCNALLKQIPGYTKEKYLKDYFEEA